MLTIAVSSRLQYYMRKHEACGAIFLRSEMSQVSQQGYVLPMVVLFSVTTFFTILVTLQYITAITGSFENTLRREAATDIANEQLRQALNCADQAGSHTNCGVTNMDTGSVNNYPSKTSTVFSQASQSVEATTTTTVGNPLGLSTSVTVKAQAQRPHLRPAGVDRLQPSS